VLGEGLKTPHHKKPACYKISKRALNLVGSCEHSNESVGSINCREFFDRLSDCKLLKKEATPWSLLDLNRGTNDTHQEDIHFLTRYWEVFHL
jgi:hypothetical protein